MSHTFVGVAVGLCWGVVVVVWVLGAIYYARTATRARRRQRIAPVEVSLVIVAWVAIAVLCNREGQHLFDGALAIRIPGLVILAAATAFTLWARLSLSTMWSLGAIVRDDHQLRTHGPYAVTRHPIYTGLLGMLIGTMLLSGIGRWIQLVLIGGLAFGFKAIVEERLMMSTFPEEYPRYRERVPRLVPRPRLRRGRARPAG